MCFPAIILSEFDGSLVAAFRSSHCHCRVVVVIICVVGVSQNDSLWVDPLAMSVISYVGELILLGALAVPV